MTPVSVSRALNEYICPSSNWIEWGLKKIAIYFDFLDKNVNFGHFRLFVACFWPVVAPVSISKALNEYI